MRVGANHRAGGLQSGMTQVTYARKIKLLPGPAADEHRLSRCTRRGNLAAEPEREPQHRACEP
jgi:hypothetical protein